MLKLLFSPLVSLFVFTLGSSLFTTLVILRLHEAHFSSLIIGAMTSAYYAGLVIGSFRSERFILRVGHIRAFSFFASLLAVICIAQGMYVEPWFWLLLRMAGGFATAGLFIVIESWLLIIGDIKTRGKVLSFYMVTLYAAQGIGQFLINFGSPAELTLFALAAMLSSLAVIPLSITKIGQPEISEPVSLSFLELYKLSTSGVIGCLCSGLILGAIYGLLPLFLTQSLPNLTLVSVFMALTIFGGMALQYPIGKLSDMVDRRIVLIIISCLVTAISIFSIFAFHYIWVSALALFIFGGLTFTLYPISISYACDSLSSSHMVAATQGLLLTYSIGAAIGPFISPIFMHYFGKDGLFIYFCCMSTFMVCFFLWRKTQSPAPVQEDTFVVMPLTTPITAELDPRTE
ncbi:MAG TPA: MFS transporter [Legionellales bacterium]|nr:MFS transporter [Legionellales bacterium]|tara:strand:- start:2416 stop:3621 length:1206 start_codon:yes stop_codon:yes gene_type:complete